MQSILKINNVVKIYANNFKALSGLTLDVADGDFFALLGANGAGKTTAINIICGLLNKTSGDIEVCGIKQSNNPNKVKTMIGLMPQEFNINIFEPIIEILINQAGYYGIDKKTAITRAKTLLKTIHLWDKRKDIAQSLSGGRKRRLMLARALMHNPKILILDEPTAGVDVEIRYDIWNFLKKLNKSGVTIILTTHYLEEAESLCKNIAIINDGKVMLKNSMHNLLKDSNKHLFSLESVKKLPDNIIIKSAICSKISDFLLKVIIDNKQNITNVIIELKSLGIIIQNIESIENHLENYFYPQLKKIANL